MPFVLEDIERFAPLVLTDPGMSDEEFIAFSREHEEFKVESTASGELVLMPLSMESGWLENEICGELRMWAKSDGRGRVFGPSTGFQLPNGARRAPDAAWISNGAMASLTPEDLRKFGRRCPEFVIELRSPSDRLTTLREKMLEWIENGAQLAWLVDPFTRTVSVYRPGREVQQVIDADRIVADGPVAGFALELDVLWRGLLRP